MSPPKPPDEAVASPVPVKLYLLHVPLPKNHRFHLENGGFSNF